ncbi:replication protein, partial [Enterococcus faecium]
MNSEKFFPSISFFFKEEQNLSKRGTIINEWEKLNRISNRRLNVQSLNTPLKIQWS